MKTIHLPQPAQSLVKEYKAKKFLLLPQFVSAAFAQELGNSMQTIPIKRVICRDKTVSFGQQHVAKDHRLHQFFNDDEVIAVLLTLTQTTTIQRFHCWTAIYHLGEFISPHTDSAGTIQLLVCLQAPGEMNGGQLVLKGEEGNTSFALQIGDAIVFEAVSIPHYTMPLMASEQTPFPVRMVAVGRYFL